MSAVTLSTLADEINYEHAHALECAVSAVRRARRAGELLLQAKEQCEHGEWLPWLKANCPRVSERTAQAYMRVARKCLGDDSKAEQLELLTLGEALEQLVEPHRTLTSDLKSATAADLKADLDAVANVTECEQAPAEEAVGETEPVTFVTGNCGISAVAISSPPKKKFDPANFARRMAELDENIDRAAAHMFANFKVDTDGLSRFERAAAWKAALFPYKPPASIPLAAGRVTVGSIGETAAVVIVESREHPGYWHDIDLREGNTSKRPVKPLGLMYRYACSAYAWTTAPDDGSYAQLCGEVSA
jgi:hypothetical protein